MLIPVIRFLRNIKVTFMNDSQLKFPRICGKGGGEWGVRGGGGGLVQRDESS